MARDDFSKPTVDTLAKRVGVRCSNPSCRKLTTGPRTDSSYIVNIGVGAHISAASPDGPRYNSSLTTEQRQAPENGIWLCQNCAKLVDNDPDRYPVDILRAWKIHAEASALAEIEGRTETEPIDCSAEIELSYERERIRSERHDYQLQVTLTNRGSKPLGPFHIDLEIPARVAHCPEKQQLYVRGRSTKDVAFFRVDSESLDYEIYPGDTKLVMGVHYYMDHDIVWSRGDLFEKPVKATLYRPGFRPFTLERRFLEFQIF